MPAGSYLSPALGESERYQAAVLQLIAEGRTVTEVASHWGVTRQTMHAWLAKYEAELVLVLIGARSRRPPQDSTHRAQRLVVAVHPRRPQHLEVERNRSWLLRCPLGEVLATEARSGPGRAQGYGSIPLPFSDERSCHPLSDGPTEGDEDCQRIAREVLCDLIPSVGHLAWSFTAPSKVNASTPILPASFSNDPNVRLCSPRSMPPR